MNLHWGKTLQHKWVKQRSRSYNYTLPLTYNITEIRLLDQKYDAWEDAYNFNRTVVMDANYTLIHPENQFLKKSRMLTDVINRAVQSHSFTTVVVIASIFLFLTLTITAAVVVFCRKRNSVFALQKSEQEDEADVEMNELDTDVEYAETDFESETDSMRLHKSLCNVAMEAEYENSPSRRPLVTCGENGDESPLHRKCRHCGSDARGNYQRMVVTAVLEKPPVRASESDDSGAETRTRYTKNSNHKYSGVATNMSSDADSETESKLYNMKSAPVINITYMDENTQNHEQVQAIKSPDSIQSSKKKGKKTPPDIVFENKHALAEMPDEKDKRMCDAAVVFVEMADKSRDWLAEHRVLYVQIPPNDFPASSSCSSSSRKSPRRARAELSKTSQKLALSKTPTVDKSTSPIQPQSGQFEFPSSPVCYPEAPGLLQNP